ncbi:hypothetical protein BH09ACT12_BH09ACT12_03330 [soil metagenome]
MTPDTPARAGTRPGLLGQVVEALLVLAVFAAAGLGAGWLWERWWTPTNGVVLDGTWVPGYRPEGDLFVFDFPSLAGFFDGTAEYVVLGVGAGLVLGVLCSLLGRRSELVMLGAIVGGSVLASLIAYRFGTHLGPVDPTSLAAAADDGTSLSANLAIKGASPFVAWPLGALLGLCLTYLLTAASSEARRRESDDPRWMERPSWLDEGSSGTRSGTAPS